MQVTIKGRIATTYLKVGEEATVERTSQIDDLADLGYIEVIDWLPEPEAAPEEPDDDAVPGEDASAADLRSYLDREGVDYPARASKAKLRAIADEWAYGVADVAPEPEEG